MNSISKVQKSPTQNATEREDLDQAKFSALGGSANDAWNRALAAQLLGTVKRNGTHPEADNRRETAALAGLIGAAPSDEVEAMIAAQLVATHNATMDAFTRAAAAGQWPETSREAINQATRLSRSFSTLLEALSRYRGKGRQTVRVEHVHVHAGGQAVVGNIEAPRGGGQGNFEE
jgi:hypothetical protein